jgi:glyoxylase-like metal-dependent hydrolase (beta-lactamase superfamily II)
MNDVEERVFGQLPDETWLYPAHGRHHPRQGTLVAARMEGTRLVS